MKLKRLLPRLGLLAVLFSTLTLQPFSAQAQGTAFTYQGRLDDSGTPANGTNDLTFTLYNAASLGVTVGTSNVFNDLIISNGLFTVTLDFGAGAFDGPARWLQIEVRPGNSSGAYTTLTPRQPLTPSPYAIFAGGASASGVTGTLPASTLAGVPLNATNLSGGTLSDARLSTNVARRTGGNVFSGSQTFTGGFQVTNDFGAFRYRGVPPIADGTTLTASLEGAGTNWPRLRFEREAGGTVMDVGQNANGDLMVKASGTERFTVMNNGNVGIGTSTPDERLEVAGTVKATAFVGPLNATNLGSGTMSDARLSTNVARRTGGNVFSGPQTFTGTFQVTNNNGALRHLGFPPSADGTALTAGLEGAGTNWPRLRFEREAGGTFMDVGQNASGDFMVKASGTERFTVMNNGNVGIGTDTPTARLEVVGTVKATSFEGQVNATNLTSGALPDARLSANVALRSGGNTFTGNQTITSGDVGIGTTTPAYKLDVNGLVNVAGIRFPDGTILRSAQGLPNVDPPIGSASFTTAGTYSWTAPSNAASIVVDIKGGGGGGGGGGVANDSVWLGPRTQSGVYTASVNPGGTGGGGGGEGNSQRFIYLVTPGTTYTIVVGAGGTAGAAGAAGQNGGDGGASFFRLGATVIASAPGGGRGFGGITIPTNATYGELFYPTGGLAGVAGVVAPGGIVTTNLGGTAAHRSNWFYMPENWTDESPINTINSSFRWTSGPYQSEYYNLGTPAGDGGPGTGGAPGVGAARNAVYNHPPTAIADYYQNREATPGQAGLPGKVSFTIY